MPIPQPLYYRQLPKLAPREFKWGLAPRTLAVEAEHEGYLRQPREPAPHRPAHGQSASPTVTHTHARTFQEHSAFARDHSQPPPPLATHRGNHLPLAPRAASDRIRRQASELESDSRLSSLISPSRASPTQPGLPATSPGRLGYRAPQDEWHLDSARGAAVRRRVQISLIMMP